MGIEMVSDNVAHNIIITTLDRGGRQDTGHSAQDEWVVPVIFVNSQLTIDMKEGMEL